MPCLNPLDPQTMRIHDTSGAFQSVVANSGGGQNRCGVLTFPAAPPDAQHAPRQPRPVCYENHAQDSRVRIFAKDVCPTIGASHAGSPDFSPLVHQRIVCYDGYNQPTHDEISFTLRSAMSGTERNDADPKLLLLPRTLAFAIDSENSNAMKSPNPNSGSRRVEAAPTLTTFDPGPERKHGGVAVVAFTANQRDEVRQIGGSGQVAAALAATVGKKQQTWLLQNARAATVRMRAGKPGGGKGALVSTERSLTLACNNDQTLFITPTTPKETNERCHA